VNELQALLSRNLKTLRAYRNLTQDGLAEAAGISKNYVAEIEIGRKYPSATVHIKLSRALGVKPYQLLFESGGPSGYMPVGNLHELLVREVTAAIGRHVPSPGDTQDTERPDSIERPDKDEDSPRKS
jgi:transcriptional regulator with XRE-family HTH domain